MKANVSKILALLLLLVALVLALMAWWLSGSGNTQKNTSSSVATETVVNPLATQYAWVAAKRSIVAGQVIAADDLQLKSGTEQLVGSTDKSEEVVGSIALVDLPEGSAILNAHLATGLATQIADGERAISIKVDEPMAVGHRIAPGDFVDVFFILGDAQGMQRGDVAIERQARLLIARKRVLAYGALSTVDAKTKDDQQKTLQARTAVLAVPLEEVERLALGENYGKLFLALRNPTDKSEPDLSLFAKLPSAITAVKAGTPQKPEDLQGMNRSYAGVLFNDLALDRNKKTPVLTAKAVAAPRPIVNRAVVAATPRDQFEIIRGVQSEKTSY